MNTQPETKHTPTPFSLPLEVAYTREGPSIRDAQGERIAEAYTERGAALIVRAVNSHAQLVAALEFLKATAPHDVEAETVEQYRVFVLRCVNAALSAAKEGQQ